MSTPHNQSNSTGALELREATLGMRSQAIRGATRSSLCTFWAGAIGAEIEGFTGSIVPASTVPLGWLCVGTVGYEFSSCRRKGQAALTATAFAS